jgi:hypothetical protein
MSNVVYLKQEFGPDELHEIGVAYENCCAALPEVASSHGRERLAQKLIGWATVGKPDATQLYMRALHTYRALRRL